MRSRPGNLFEMHRDVQRALQLLILNEEFAPQMRGGGE